MVVFQARVLYGSKDEEILVSSPDFARVIGYNWTVHKSGYAFTNINGKIVAMHRFIMPGHPEIDHANRNRLDNRRENLRPCTHEQNQRNLGPYLGRKKYGVTLKGVRFVTKSKRYQARIRYDGAVHNLGCFGTEQEAHEAYCAAARLHHGEFFRAA